MRVGWDGMRSDGDGEKARGRVCGEQHRGKKGERVTASPPRERERPGFLWPFRCLVLRVAMLVLRCSFKHILAWHLFWCHVIFYDLASHYILDTWRFQEEEEETLTM